MEEYFLETREFGLSENGVHLLRSRFNYETIPYNNIRELTIEKGKEVNNWILLLTVGAIMFLFSIWYSFKLFNIIGKGEVPSVYIEEIVVPVLPFLLGLFFLYSSTRTGKIMSFTTNEGKQKRLSVSQLKKDKLDELKNLLKDKLSTRIKIEV